MKQESLKVLGAYGTRANKRGSTSFLLDEKTALDAGNLLDGLAQSSTNIEAIWLTHSHLDHIVDIAYIIENYFALRKKRLKIMALPETIEAIQEHFLNDAIWPDFSLINMYNSNETVVEYIEIKTDCWYKIDEKSSIRAFMSDHTVVCCGYIYQKGEKKILFGADTYSLQRHIELLEEERSITAAIIECSFPNNMHGLAKISKHLTPQLLFQQLKKLSRRDIIFYINHIKPAYEKKIIEEIEVAKEDFRVKIIKDGDFLYF
jgi:cAMP phosphodiesterase